MKRFFGEFIDDKQIKISNDEFEHLKRVLRMKEGDKAIASVNDEYDYYCKIEKMEKNFALLAVEDKKLCPALPKKQITLFQMMPKKEYFDNILAKSIELGVSELFFFDSEYCMVKTLKLVRVQKQIMTACKQCTRSKMPDAHKVIKFQDMLAKLNEYDIVIFANEKESKPLKAELFENKSKIAIIIGNEAGFSAKEAEKIIQNGGYSVSLGSRILRCDTATIALLSIVNFLTKN